MKNFLCLVLLSYSSLFWNYAKAQWITNHDPQFMPEVIKPTVYNTFADPVFGSTVERISDCLSQGFNGIVPQYSKRQAWNSDDSRLLLFSGDGEAILLDGSNYNFLKTLNGVGGEDVFWHPSDPDIIFYNLDSVLYTYDITTDIATQIHSFTNYTWANTRGEGNMSLDGRYYAVVGQQYNYSTGDVTFKDIVVYDLQTDAEISVMPIPQDSIAGFDWASVSPNGNYVVIDYADDVTGRFHGVEVYDRNMNFIWQKPLGAGHSDLGIDGNGDEVLVMDVYNADSNITYIKKFRLSDGQETTLLAVSELFDLHISLRNELRREWCFISTFDYTGRLSDDSLSWLPFEDEVFALRLDGSEDVQRIAHHHSRRYSPLTPDSDNSVYWSEPHATISRNGERIIFGSNWRQNIDQLNSLDVYLVDFGNLLGIQETAPESSNVSFYPNPAQNKVYIHFADDYESIDIFLYDLNGKEIKSIHLSDVYSGNNSIEIDISDISNGIFLCTIITDKICLTKRIEKFNN